VTPGADRDPRTATTLVELIRRRAELSPATPYFHLYDDTVTYAGLWAQTGRYAAGLARAGVGQGDKVALIYPTCAEFFFTFFGALRLGAVPVPLYPTLGVEGTANILRDSEAVAVATIGWFRQGVDAAVELASKQRCFAHEEVCISCRFDELRRRSRVARVRQNRAIRLHPEGVRLELVMRDACCSHGELPDLEGDVGLVLAQMERALEHVREAEPLTERREEGPAPRLHPERRFWHGAVGGEIEAAPDPRHEVAPVVEVKSRRVGGSNYQIPIEVRGDRRQSLAFRWLILAANIKRGRPMADKLSDEILLASQGQGDAVKKREDVQRMAEANRAFAHFA
jgi:hypothetical protein